MLSNPLYSTQQIVWAKVQPYPWWPAKIIKIIQQTEQTLYKVLFFADRTYSHLHPNNMHQFDDFIPPFNQSFVTPQTQQSLQKALKLVQEHRKKSQTVANKRKMQQILQSEQIIEQTCGKVLQMMEEKVDEGSGELQWQSRVSDSMDAGLGIDSISIMNVIEMIEMNRKPQKKIDYCYQKRKQQISIIKKLKQKLLLKYNLLEINHKSNLIKDPKSSIINSNHEQKYKRIMKEKKVSPKERLLQRLSHGQQRHDVEFFKHKCTQKIKRILSSPQDQHHYIRTESLDIIRRITYLADNNYVKFHSLVMSLIKSIARSNPSLKCDDKLLYFKHYLQRLQQEKQWDQEGSKLTQIDAIN